MKIKKEPKTKAAVKTHPEHSETAKKPDAKKAKTVKKDKPAEKKAVLSKKKTPPVKKTEPEATPHAAVVTKAIAPSTVPVEKKHPIHPPVVPAPEKKKPLKDLSAPVVPPPVVKPVPPSIKPPAPKMPARSDKPALKVPEKPMEPRAPVIPPPPPKPVEPARPAAPRVKIKINEFISVKDLADRMNVKVPDVIKKLMSMRVLATINQRLDSDTATMVADTFQFDVEVIPLYAEEALESPDDPSKLKARPPVVTIMGHVDHGKTSLLDAIRQTRVAEKEAGGITQHIGAYQVKTEKGTISFLDTPGHEAFTAMRARGAQATDLVVLVVAADDGVMPQTIEALDHARAAGVPIVVAINKCDLPNANPQKVKQELSNHQLITEEWGGKTIMVEVSARQKLNLDKLLEMILLEAEILELKADPTRSAQGVVVEARMDQRRGPVATVLIQKGTLHVGDAFVCGMTFGKVRALLDHKGQRIKEAVPSQPVEILGFSRPPETGVRFQVVATDSEAREIAEKRASIADEESKKRRQHVTLETLHQAVSAGKLKNLPIIIKADVQGSVEAVRDSLERMSYEGVTVKSIHVGVGAINESDILLASASDAIILGFNVRPDPSSEDLARRESVEIRTYRIIYDMVNDVKAALEGLLEPLVKEVTQGWADVRQVFRITKSGTVAGCYVTEGKAARSAKARLLRNGTIVFEGTLSNLKRFKDDVREVEKGFECGISLEGYQDIKPGDRIEFYSLEKQTRLPKN
ncbi:MAG TPA: translation initiation factor IF-2 [Elusimicrobiota bacterium]|nr:translation initiation factor IF-2 [Elusimicrobiota bacterium]